MKSTEIILDITDKFGEDRKPELTRALKELRLQVKKELMYHMRRGLLHADNEYNPSQIKNNRALKFIKEY